MADSFLDVLKRSGASSATTSTSPAPLTFGAALLAKGHFRHGDGKFRTGKPVPLADLADLEADVPADDPGLLDAVAKFTAGETPPPIDVAVDPDGNRALIRGKKRLAAARATGQETIPVRFTQVAEPFGKADAGEAWKDWHGHVRPRPDGVKARCGGPAICSTCKAEQEQLAAQGSGSSGSPPAPAPPRTLQPIDDKTSYPPFPYDQTVFARLRPDQVPRFLGVLTNPERWPLQTVKLSDLLAMQNRVDTAKVQAKVQNGGGGHEPIVVALEPGRLHIADGHHDLAAAWLRGEDEKAVRFADLTAVTNVLKADMPVAPGTKVRVKAEHRADNWFLERVGDAIGEVIASWVVAEGEKAGVTALAVEWLTPGISGMYRGLDAAKVDVVSRADLYNAWAGECDTIARAQYGWDEPDCIFGATPAAMDLFDEGVSPADALRRLYGEPGGRKWGGYVGNLPQPETYWQGLYSSVRPDGTSAAALVGWCAFNGVPNAVPPEDLHATIIYSRQPVRGYQPSDAAVTVDAASFRLGILDGKLLVLHFASPDLEARHAAARALGATWDFPSYQPHITLSTDIGSFDWVTLKPPQFPISLGDEKVEPLDVQWTPAVTKALRCAPDVAYARDQLAKAAKKAAKLPAVGDIIDFDDDRFTDKGPASGPVAAVIRNSVIINFGDGYPEDIVVVDWSFVIKQAKADRWEKPSGKVVWSVHGKPDDPAPAEGVAKGGAPGPAFTLDAKICKVDTDQRLVFGWFSIVEIDGQPVTDREGDRVAPAELEKAAYGHVLDARVASDTHVLIGVGNLVESCIFTVEKQQAMVASLQAMGIPAVLDLHCVGWWGGYYITSDKVWAEIKAGNYVSFSIGGNGTRTTAAGGSA